MTIKEFTKHFPETEREKAVADLVRTADIWSNKAAMGYAIRAAQLHGLDDDRIGVMLAALSMVLQDYSPDDAAALFEKYEKGSVPLA